MHSMRTAVIAILLCVLFTVRGDCGGDKKAFHPEYGWATSTEIKQFDKGLVEVDGKWVAAEEADRLHDSWKSAWVVETDHWILQSDYRYFYLRNCLAWMDAEYELFTRLFKNILTKDADGKKMEVYLFKNRQGYVDHVQSFAGAMAANPENTGFFDTESNRAYFYYVEPDPAEDRKVPKTLATLKHECCHQLFFNLCGMVLEEDVPAFWAEEGIPCVMEAFELDAKGKPQLPALKKFMEGDWYKSYAYFAGEKKLMPLAELVQVKPKGFWEMVADPANVERGQAFYSYSTVVCYYLLTERDNGFGDKMLKYLHAAMIDKKTDADLFEQHFAQAAAVEKNLPKFFR